MSSDINYSFYGVGFIDVLGQKEDFAGITDFPANGETDEEFKSKLVEAHKKTAHFINQFRDGFESYFNAYTNIGSAEQNIRPEKRAQYKEMSKCSLKLVRFSDCVLPYTSLETDQYHCNAMNGIYGMLAACGSMVLLSLSCRKAVRGGIDVGWGTEMPSGEVYGPALFRAYELESKVAKYPRVVIGETLLTYLENLSVRNKQIPDQTKEDIELCKSLSDSCLKMIVRDLDGYPILDYLGDEFRKFEKNLPKDQIYSHEKISKKAFQFAESEFLRWRKAKNQKMAIRYHQLVSYFHGNGIKP